jgi:steroid 5-alpha reductase family enzyme
MIVELILWALVTSLLYMSLWFLVGRWRKKLNTVDVAWGSGFAIIAWLVAWQQPSARSTVIAVLITIWALRLTSHLARRVFGGKEDPRYARLSKQWKGNFWLRAYFSIFMVQGLLVMLISLPIIFATGEQSADLGGLTVLGAAVWVMGFGVEAAADRQLRDFVNNKANKGLVMDLGLWRYSRHPNYFGEMVQWWGIGIIALQTHHGWVGLLGPLTLTFLLLFVSGVPLIEKPRQNDERYQDYRRRTSVILPWPPKKA